MSSLFARVGDRCKVWCTKGERRFVSHVTTVGIANEGWSRPRVVRVSVDEKTHYGFLKSATDGCCALELMLEQIGEILDVSMATTLGVYGDASYSSLVASVSLSVADKPDCTFMSFREMRDELYTIWRTGDIVMTPWMQRWIAISDRRGQISESPWEVIAKDEQDYRDCLAFAPEILRMYCAKRNLTPIGFDRDYISMVLLDILIGQADRTPSNYGLVINSVQHVVQLAPLFDNATLTKPYVPKDHLVLNHMLMKRKQVACALSRIHSDEFVSLAGDMLRKKQDVLDYVGKNRKLLDDGWRSLLAERIENGFSIIEQAI